MGGNIKNLFGAEFNARLVDPNRPEPSPIDDPEQAFMDQLAAFGMQLNGALVENKFMHLPMDNPKKKHGWYMFFGVDMASNVASGIYGDWRDGETFHWSSKSEQEMSTEEYKSYQLRVAELRRQHELEKKQKQDKAAEEAQRILQDPKCVPASEENRYLQSKGIKPHSISQVGDVLHIPMYTASGELRNVQRIYPDGFKAFLEGGQVLSCFHVIGSGTISGVAEGYATAATIHETTGATIAVCFNTANMRAVVDAIRTIHHQPLTVYSDNDWETEQREPEKGNPGIKAAQAAAEGQYQVNVCTPGSLQAGESDFNDLAARDPGQARAQLLGPEPKHTLSTLWADEMGEIEPTQWIIRNHLPADCFGSMYGPSGHGKTFNVLDMALSIAAGVEWHGREVEQGAVMYVCGEGKSGILKRLSAWCKHHEVAIEGLPFAITSRPVMMLDDDMLADFKEQLISRIERGNFSLVIIDTLNRNFGAGDENRTEDMTKFVGACDEIKRCTGASVLVVHHTGLQDATRARGSSALRAALDVEMNVEKVGEDSSRLVCTKMKDDEPFLPIMFKMLPVAVGMVKTQYGMEEVSSVVLEAHKDPEANAELARGLLAGKSKNVDIGLQIVQDMANVVRMNKPGIADEDILIGNAEFNKRFTEQVSRRQALSEVKAKLIELGVLILVEKNPHHYKLGKL